MYKTLEGHNIPPYGLIICVSQVLERQNGRVQELTGHVVVQVKVRAIVLNMKNGHVVDGTVSSVNPMGFFVFCGPLKVFVPKNNIPESYSFDGTSWVADNDKVAINSSVRLRIMAFKINPTNVTAVGQINQDYLGVFNQTY